MLGNTKVGDVDCLNSILYDHSIFEGVRTRIEERMNDIARESLDREGDVSIGERESKHRSSFTRNLFFVFQVQSVLIDSPELASLRKFGPFLIPYQIGLVIVGSQRYLAGKCISKEMQQASDPPRSQKLPRTLLVSWFPPSRVERVIER